jgi:hypothetical protein
MKTIGKVKQYFIGATPIILLWILATVSQDEVLVTPIYDTLEATTFKNFDVVLYPIIPLISLGVMLIWLFSSAIIGKKYDLKYMYYATLISAVVPTATFLFGFMFSQPFLAKTKNIFFPAFVHALLSYVPLPFV